MNAPETKDQLMPLRGPVGWREVFFTRRSSPILEHVRIRRRAQWILGILAACLLIPFIWIYHDAGDHDYTDILVLQLFAWGGTEFGCWCYGFGLGNTAGPERRRRLADLALTELRPVEIAQLLIGRRVWPLAPPLIVLTIGMSLIHYARFVERPYTVIPIVLVGVNTWITLYMFEWMQVALYLSAKSAVRAGWRQLMFMISYALYTFWMIMISIGLAILINDQNIGWRTMMMFAAMAGLFWWVKYRFAKAWATHLERAIFHRVEM